MAAENTVIFKSIAYSGGAILGGWGLIEIFLIVDPFYALNLRYLDVLGWPLAGAACALTLLHIAPGPLDLCGDVNRRKMLGAATAVLGLTLLATRLKPQVLPEVAPDFAETALGSALRDQGVLVLIGALLATAVASAVCPAVPSWQASRNDPERIWPHWLGIPVVVGIAVFSIMLLLVATGRARSLTEGDIAQEELRRGGLEFSMTSLQEALYLISPRSVELFRKAHVDDDDILDALGAPTGFTDEAPLVTSILSRIDGDDNLFCADNTLDDVNENSPEGVKRDEILQTRKACLRIDSFIRLFLAEPERKWYEQIFQREETDSPICFTSRKQSTERKMPGDGGSEVNPLCSRLEAAIPLQTPDGAPPRPLLSYAVSGGHANVASCVWSLCRHPGSDIEIRPLSDGLADGLADGAEFDPAQNHIRFAIDPYWAVKHARSAPDSPWAPEEASKFVDFLKRIGVKSGEHPLTEARVQLAGAAGETTMGVNGIHVTHLDGRCRTRPLTLSKTGQGQLHDNKPFQSYVLASGDGEDAAPRGLLVDYGSKETRLRLIHERLRAGGGERLAVLDQVPRQKGLNPAFLSGTDTSVLLWLDGTAVPEPASGDIVRAVPYAPAEAQVAASLGREKLPVELETTGQIVLSGRAEADLCLEVLSASDPEGRVIADAFVPHARKFTLETDALPAGSYIVRVTALHDDPDAAPTTMRVGLRRSLYCSHEAPRQETKTPQLLGTSQPINAYRPDKAAGNRLYCPFRSENYAQVTFTVAAEADVQARLIERPSGTSSQDTTPWTDDATSGSSDAPAREIVTKMIEPKRDYILEVRPYENAEMTGTPLEVTLTEGPAVTEGAINDAVAKAVRVDGGTAADLDTRTAQVAAARVTEAGLYTVEAADNARAFRFAPAAERPLLAADGNTILNLPEGAVLLALATSADGGRVMVDPIASRAVVLGFEHRFDPLASGTKRVHLVQPSGDGPLEITLTPLGNADLDLTVRSPDGRDLGSSTASGASVDSVIIDAQAGEPLIAEVLALGTSAYALRATGVRESVSELPELQIGMPYTGAPLPANERFRLRLQADRAGVLAVSLAPTQADLDLSVLSLSGEELGSSTNMGTATDAVTLTTVAGQVLIVEVHAFETSGFTLSADYR